MRKKILIEFPKAESFEVCEGYHPAITKQVFVTEQPYKELSEHTVRIKWHLPLLDTACTEYVVAKSYPLSLDPRHDLRKDLESWLGKERLQTMIVDGQLDILQLEGLRADLRVKHGPVGTFKHPFVNVVEVAPEGTYVRVENPTHAPSVRSLKDLRN